MQFTMAGKCLIIASLNLLKLGGAEAAWLTVNGGLDCCSKNSFNYYPADGGSVSLGSEGHAYRDLGQFNDYLGHRRKPFGSIFVELHCQNGTLFTQGFSAGTMTTENGNVGVPGCPCAAPEENDNNSRGPGL